MGDNITELERLLQQLIEVTSLIANATDGGVISAKEDDDDADSTSNRLARGAIIIAVAAFLIAALQAILEYSNSGETARRKCDATAIGVYSRLVKKRWSLRSWRRKFDYPELDITWVFFTAGIDNRRRDSNLMGLLKGLVDTDSAFRWHVVYFMPEPREIYDGYRALEKSGKRVTVDDLPILYRSKLWWHEFYHGNARHRPRATWAQLLAAFNLNNPMRYTYHGQQIKHEDYADADCIPAALDVPIQRLDFKYLGTLAFLLGLDTVTINLKDREFQAMGTFGSITTEELNGFGKVLRFQNNTSNVLCDAAYYPEAWLNLGRDLLHGCLHLYDDRVARLFAVRQPQREEAERMSDIINSRIESVDHHDSSPSQVQKENKYPTTSAAQDIEKWRNLIKENGVQWPSILGQLAAALLPFCKTAFPQVALLNPFLAVLQLLASDITQKLDVTVRVFPNDGACRERLIEDGLFYHGVVGMLRAPDDQPKHIPGRRTSGSTWLNDAHDLMKGSLPQKLPCCALVGCSVRSELPPEMGSSLLSAREELLPLVADYLGYQFSLERGGEPMISEFYMKFHILTSLVGLIQDFDPKSWAQSRTPPNYDIPYGDPDTMRPTDALWMQIFLLDMHLKHILNDILQLQNVPKLLEGMTRCINESVRGQTDDRFPMEKLEAQLVAFFTPESGGMTDPSLPDLIRQLSDLIKLRVLFFGAYLMLLPDSSDLYRVPPGPSVVLPMI
ncbi:hypothetical protein F4778DRAFT_130323 [Xylariomycetidae sp. FL2044]|nr:hypothetical protein F4778DRAFT_130323 [Xylariomycetidae sp. FL2044]